MGLDTNGVRSLLYGKRSGVDFSRTAMIGRQSFQLGEYNLKLVLESFNYMLSSNAIHKIRTVNKGFAEPLLALLGANTIHSFDNSEYEGATHVNDLNLDLPDHFREQYTAVIDAGSLEHVFNFPVAIKNCMEMVCVAGHYIAITPMNNFAGHGFYQFSPELFFSVFKKDNGFEIINVISFEDRPDAQWYSVMSPIEAKERVTLSNSYPTYLLVIARKVASMPIFKTVTQQSDYVSVWNNEGKVTEETVKVIPKAIARQPKFLAFLKKVSPTLIKKLLKTLLFETYPVETNPFTPRHFSPIDPTKD